MIKRLWNLIRRSPTMCVDCGDATYKTKDEVLAPSGYITFTTFHCHACPWSR